MIKTRQTRFANRIGSMMAARANPLRFSGIVPKSVALQDHCKQRNYGTQSFAYVERTVKRLRRLLGFMA